MYDSMCRHIHHYLDEVDQDPKHSHRNLKYAEIFSLSLQTKRSCECVMSVT